MDAIDKDLNFSFAIAKSRLRHGHLQMVVEIERELRVPAPRVSDDSLKSYLLPANFEIIELLDTAQIVEADSLYIDADVLYSF